MADNLPRITFSYSGVDFASDEKRFINLTAMWRAEGSPPNREPKNWRRKEGASFIEHRSSVQKVPVSHLFRIEKGRNGSTWCHWQIALAYAKYLSDEFHSVANEAFREWHEEKADPGLKIERGIDEAKQQGWSDYRIRARVEGVLKRNTLTETLKSHGIEGVGYAVCTDEINVPILGGTAAQYRRENGIPPKEKTRDHVPADKLNAISFAEAMAASVISKNGVEGTKQCSKVCRRASEVAADAMKAMGIE